MKKPEKETNFRRIRKGLWLRTNGDLLVVCEPFEGQVVMVDEHLVGIRRSDGKKSRVGPDGTWLVSRKRASKDAWFQRLERRI